MMRVLHVIGAMDRGGAETMIMNLYRKVDRDRVQFDFLVHEQRACDYDAEIEQLGGHLYRLPRFTGANFFAYRTACRQFFAQHAKDYQVVHGHIGSCAAIYLAEAKRAGLVTIAHSHAKDFIASPASVAFKAVSFPTRFVADRFLACSRDAGLDRFGARVVAGDRFCVLNNGIDVDAYACTDEEHLASRAQYACGDDALVVGHVGRLSPEKNHRFLLDVFKEIERLRPGSRLVCVGRGPLEQQLRERAQRLGIADAVTFTGVRTDVPALLRGFDVFVFTSTSEGLAMAAVEAQAAGCPTLVSTGVPEDVIVTDRARRLDLSAGAQAWAEATLELASDGAGRESGACGVRAHGFDVGETALWLMDYYERVAQATQRKAGKGE